jgi:hypothetical protein
VAIAEQTVSAAEQFRSASRARNGIDSGQDSLCLVLRQFLLEEELASLIAYTLGRAADFVETTAV